MSSFWNLFGKEEKPPAEGEGDADDATAAAQQQQQPAKPSAAPKAGGGQASVAPKQTGTAAAATGGAPALEGRPAPPVLPPARSSPRYGIDEAIRLMRTLPVDDNPDLVVRVIKRTLESLSVKVPDIIEDAAKRQESLRAKISEHQAAIVQLEREIDARRFDIGRLEDELSETTQVRERLQLAEQLPVTPNAPRVGAPAAPATGGSSVITGGSNPPPSAQKKPPLPTTFRPKPTGDLKKTTPDSPAANTAAAAGAFPAPPKADEKKPEEKKTAVDEKKPDEKKDESSPGGATAKTEPTSRESKSDDDDDDDDDDDEPVESRDMIDKS